MDSNADLGSQLIEAIRAGDAGAVKTLLDESEDARTLVSTSVHYGYPLANALAQSRMSLDIITLLVTAGADVNTPHSCLAKAAGAGEIEVVEFLLKHGATVNSVSTILSEPCMKGYVAIVRALLDSGTDVNARCSFDRIDSALQFACHFGHLDLARLLLDRGADPNRPTRYETPLMLACRAGSEDPSLVNLLLERGADVNSEVDAKTQTEGWTALMFAVHKRQPAVARLLLERGANPNVACCDWEYPMAHMRVTPLRYAQREGMQEVTAMLLTAGAKA